MSKVVQYTPQKRPLYLGVAPMIPITHPFRKVSEKDGPPS